MTHIITNPAERTRFIKFALVGMLGAVIDFGVMNLLTRLIGMNLVPAGTISFICAVISNFIWNRYWTYPESRSRHVLHQLGMFFLVNIAGIGIRIPILLYAEPPLMYFFDDRYMHNPITADVLAKNVTLAIAVGIVMLWNFFVNRYWTYNDVTNEV
jgi:putative flippase GtrA